MLVDQMGGVMMELEKDDRVALYSGDGCCDSYARSCQYFVYFRDNPPWDEFQLQPVLAGGHLLPLPLSSLSGAG